MLCQAIGGRCYGVDFSEYSEYYTSGSLVMVGQTDPDIKAALGELAKAIRFSDPMSNEKLADLEKEIIDKFAELKAAEDKRGIIAVLNSLIAERNKKVKLLK